MVKILHIVGNSKYGGGFILIERLVAKGLKYGYDLAVLATDPIVQQKLSKAGITFVDLNCIWRPIHPIHDVIGLFRLWRYLYRNSWDIVHTHTSKAGFVGRIAAKLGRVPIVIHTVHGFAFHEASSTVELLAYSLLERIAAHFCDALITVSRFHCDWAARLGIGSEHKRIAISNGIDPARIVPFIGRDPTRASLGIKNSDVLCLTMGRLAQQKGLEFLLKALALVDEREPLKVVIAGEGEERTQLEYLSNDLNLEKRVLFLGFRTDLGDLLAASDLVVLPSVREGLSISLLEAMAAGKAIITTDIGSNLEVTRNGKAALIVKVQSTKELAEAMLSLTHDKNTRDQLGRVALAIFEQEYREDIMLKRYMELYARLLRTRKSKV